MEILILVAVIVIAIFLFSGATKENKEAIWNEAKADLDALNVEFDDLAYVWFEYKDARKKEVTRREVHVKSINTNAKGEQYFRCYCNLRKKARSFTPSLIQNGEIVLISTGEVLPVQEYIDRCSALHEKGKAIMARVGL